MRKALLFDVDTCKEKNAGGEHITHQAEELDQGVRRVGACLAAQILHGAGGDGVDGRVKRMVRDKARHDEKKEPEQAYSEDLFSQLF